MTKTEATAGAREVANREQISMVVAEEPYSETPAPENFSYYPAGSAHIFKHNKTVLTIEPAK